MEVLPCQLTDFRPVSVVSSCVTRSVRNLGTLRTMVDSIGRFFPPVSESVRGLIPDVGITTPRLSESRDGDDVVLRFGSPDTMVTSVG